MTQPRRSILTPSWRQSLSFIVFATVICSMMHSVTDGARVLIYPFGHCMNSHLLAAVRMGEILAEAGYDVDMLVNSGYRGYDHLVDSGSEKSCNDQKSCRTEELGTADCDLLSKCTTGACEKKRGSINLLEFAPPENSVPAGEEDDTIDSIISTALEKRLKLLYTMAVTYCDQLLSDKPLMQRLKDTQYSLIILESADECSRILADYLDRPFVLLVNLGLGVSDGNPRPPSYYPSGYSSFTPNMAFPQRVVNFLYVMLYERAMPVLMGFMEPFRELRRKHGYNSSLSLDDSFKRASLKMINNDFSIEYPAPMFPDTVLIGGFAVQKPAALPADLLEFIDGSGEDGVIIVSFGTFVRRYSTEWTNMFLKAFGQLRQRVIWRYHGEIENVSVQYPNVKLMKWLPQSDLLANPKTRLFISHSGLNGFFEASHYGVPVLAIPLWCDQFYIAVKIADYLHTGIRVDITTMTAESLYSDIQRLIMNESYSHNARQIAARLRDQPMTAVERIIFWIDYVIRHNGAYHLRSGALDMPLYQYLSLDVIGFLLLALFLIGLLLFVCIRSLLHLVRFCCLKALYKSKKE